MKRLLVLLVFLLPANSALALFDTMYVRIQGDTTDIWEKGEENCGSLFVATASLSSDSVVVLETDTSSRLAFCDCYFTMRMSLVGLPIGSYHAVVYRQRLKKYLPWLPNDTTWFFGSVDFTISQQNGSPLTQDFRQSTCNGSLDEVRAASHPILPIAIRLSIFPNPFNPETTIEYWTPQSSHVTLEVFDILGRRIVGLADEKQPAGTHRVRFSTDRLSSGVYVCRLRVGQQTTSRLLLALR